MHAAMAAETTCISCHKGIVHHLPELTPVALVSRGTSTEPRIVIGSVAYTAATVPLFLGADEAAKGGAGEGSLLPASQVEVIARSGAVAEVKITGWQQQGVERAVYALLGQRILTAVLTPAAIARLQMGAARTDAATGLVWHTVTLSAWVSSGTLMNDQAQLWSDAARVYASSCGTCHTPPSPAAYTANQWPGTAGAMQPRTALTGDQYRLVVKYLQFHAKDAMHAK